MDVILHLTHECQLACTYCYAGGKRAAAMSWDVARAGIDLFFAQPATDTPSLIGFFGGEPLLELPLLERCVAYAGERSLATGKPCRLELTTNGLLLNDEVARWLRSRSIRTTLSLDGAQEAQDACRRYPGGASSFADTRDALAILIRHSPDALVCTVINPANVGYLPESVDFLVESGVRHLILNPDFFTEWDERDVEAWRAGYDHVARRVEEEFRAGRPLHVNVITAKIITHLKGGYDPHERCEFGREEIAIAPSGNIYACHRLVGEDSGGPGLIGDVFGGFDARACGELADCWSASNPECVDCDVRHRCRNWCSCVNHRLTGHFDRTGPIVCLHERMAMEAADRVASHLFSEGDPAFMETFYLQKEIDPEWA